MIAKVVICDSCGVWHQGKRKELPPGWRTRKSLDICPQCPDPQLWAKKESTAQRNLEMLVLRRSGQTYRQIAQKYGISLGRVQQICHVEERKEWMAQFRLQNRSPIESPK